MEKNTAKETIEQLHKMSFYKRKESWKLNSDGTRCNMKSPNSASSTFSNSQLRMQLGDIDPSMTRSEKNVPAGQFYLNRSGPPPSRKPQGKLRPFANKTWSKRNPATPFTSSNNQPRQAGNSEAYPRPFAIKNRNDQNTANLFTSINSQPPRAGGLVFTQKQYVRPTNSAEKGSHDVAKPSASFRLNQLVELSQDVTQTSHSSDSSCGNIAMFSQEDQAIGSELTPQDGQGEEEQCNEEINKNNRKTIVANKNDIGMNDHSHRRATLVDIIIPHDEGLVKAEKDKLMFGGLFNGVTSIEEIFPVSNFERANWATYGSTYKIVSWDNEVPHIELSPDDMVLYEIEQLMELYYSQPLPDEIYDMKPVFPQELLHPRAPPSSEAYHPYFHTDSNCVQNPAEDNKITNSVAERRLSEVNDINGEIHQTLEKSSSLASESSFISFMRGIHEVSHSSVAELNYEYSLDMTEVNLAQLSKQQLSKGIETHSEAMQKLLDEVKLRESAEPTNAAGDAASSAVEKVLTSSETGQANLDAITMSKNKKSHPLSRIPRPIGKSKNKSF